MKEFFVTKNMNITSMTSVDENEKKNLDKITEENLMSSHEI